MKKLIVILSLICWIPLWAEDETEPVDYGSMYGWETYYSYYDISSLVKTSNAVYCLADGSLFSLDLDTKELTRWNKMKGLNGGEIQYLLYTEELDKVVVIYANNMLDVIDKNGNIEAIRDLYQTTSKAIKIQCAYVYQKIAYLGTNFGIIAINLQKLEVADTYYIGDLAKDVSVTNITIANDTIFAHSPNLLYKTSLHNNLLSYSEWETETLPQGNWSCFTTYDRNVWAICNEVLYFRQAGKWERFSSSQQWKSLKTQSGKFFLIDKQNNLYEHQDNPSFSLLFSNNTTDAAYDAKRHVYWLAVADTGLVELDATSLELKNIYIPDGPIRNDVYSLTFAGEKLFICPGFRWVDRGKVDASFAYRNPDGSWGYETDWHTTNILGTNILDLVAIGVDPNDDGHFFMSSYGMGIVEYRNNLAYKQFTEGTEGCYFQSLVEGNLNYVRTEGATVDNNGYLWVIQPETRPLTIHVMNLASGVWTAFNLNYNGQRTHLNTPRGIWMDRRNPNHKWMMAQRAGAGLLLLDDNGTPANPSDDRCVFRSTLQDQNNNDITFSTIYAWEQDKNDDIWVGLEGGLLIIPSTENFMTSNKCKRIIIPRNDGTGLADYLLANDNVCTIAVDGGNRKWLGTESSGVFLVSPDGMTTIYHFTEENSPLPSNNISDIAIHPITGEVFIGTSAGLVSFRSDAAEAKEDYSHIVAYPNPIRPNYDGVVTISGLMEETIVNIIDQGGQLVCKTHANGGTAVWDLKNGNGQRVSSGIYTALCNNKDGNHQLVKIMVMNR